METLKQDVLLGIRMLARTPSFTFVAVLTLALAIGLNTAIFSLISAVLIRPLPFKNPAELVQLRSVDTRGEGQWDVSSGDFIALRNQNDAFQQMALYKTASVNLTDPGEPETVSAIEISANLFDLLDVKPDLGVSFTPNGAKAGDDNVIVISNRLWRAHFNSDMAVIGRTVTLDGRSFTVLGVMPRGFAFPEERRTDIWIPLYLAEADQSNHGDRNAQVVARLRPSVTIRQAQTELDVIAARLAEAYPKSDKGWLFRIAPLHEQVVGNSRPLLLLLSTAVGFVLLIACANVANLSLARGAARRREIAIREALGASLMRIIRQLMTENLLIALIGGGLGLLIAFGGIHFLRLLAPDSIPQLNQARIDGSVLFFTAILSVTTGILFGLVPAIEVSKVDLNGSLKEGARTGDSGLRIAGKHKTRNVLVISEVALAVVLLVGAGLMLRSFNRLVNVSPGFDMKNVLTMGITLSASNYRTAQEQGSFFGQVLDQVSKVPGVRGAAISNLAALTGSWLSSDFVIEQSELTANQEPPEAQFEIVSPDFFRTLRISLLTGRYFTARDTQQTPAVVIVNETMARRFWRHVDPIGKRISLDWAGAKEWREVVGVVSDTRESTLSLAPTPKVFVPYAQSPSSSMILFVRTATNPSTVTPLILVQIWNVDKNQPVTNIMTLQQALSRSVTAPRFRAVLVGALAGLALVLALMGIYGLISYLVARRSHEIGIRMALGASAANILRLVMGQALAVTLIGVVIGVIIAAVLSRFLSSFLYEIRPVDPLSFIAAIAAITIIALLASYLPARHAIRISPLTALRQE